MVTLVFNLGAVNGKAFRHRPVPPQFKSPHRSIMLDLQAILKYFLLVSTHPPKMTICRRKSVLKRPVDKVRFIFSIHTSEMEW